MDSVLDEVGLNKMQADGFIVYRPRHECLLLS